MRQCVKSKRLYPQIQEVFLKMSTQFSWNYPLFQWHTKITRQESVFFFFNYRKTPSLAKKIADISRHQRLLPRETMSGKRAQKFHTDDVSIPRSGWCFWLVENLLQPIRNTTHHFYHLMYVLKSYKPDLFSICNDYSIGWHTNKMWRL